MISVNFKIINLFGIFFVVDFAVSSGSCSVIIFIKNGNISFTLPECFQS